jgi:hypothetical protein
MKGEGWMRGWNIPVPSTMTSYLGAISSMAGFMIDVFSRGDKQGGKDRHANQGTSDGIYLNQGQAISLLSKYR